MKVDVYYNLKKGSKEKPCYSVKSREKEDYGRVVLHASELLIKNCEFVIQPSGLERAQKNETRNVHAFVRGKLVFYQRFEFEPMLEDWKQDGVSFTYDIKKGSFVTEEEKELEKASAVFLSNKEKTAFEPKYK